jgi:SAM-dependent methyltransferase
LGKGNKGEEAMTDVYSSTFYDDFQRGSRMSAEVILPPIFKAISPRTVIDIGCGVGTWISVAQKLGAQCVGLEGSWVKDVGLRDFDIRVADLEKPLPVAGKFDLAFCLEVGEHLSTERSASLVRELCSLADYVLFSAAIPGQGGRSHINEQWQSWWSDLFAKNGFVLIDCIRPGVWNNRAVDWWYRQNAFLYVAKSKCDALALPKQSSLPIDIMHPERPHNGPHAEFSLRRSIGSLIPQPIKSGLKSIEREIWMRVTR